MDYTVTHITLKVIRVLSVHDINREKNLSSNVVRQVRPARKLSKCWFIVLIQVLTWFVSASMVFQ